MTPKRTKTVKVKGVGIMWRDSLFDVHTYGERGEFTHRRGTRKWLRSKQMVFESEQCVDCTITFQLPNRTKKGKP